MIRFGGSKRPLSTKVWSVARSGGNINQLKQETIQLEESKIIVQVNAISINPIDQLILNGRLETIQSLKYKLKNKPIERIIPGREFHGTVISSKCPKFEIGDHVVGLKHPTETFGTLSEYISSRGCDIIHAPSSLSPEEACSVGFTGLTLVPSLGLSPSLPPSGEAPLDMLSDVRGKNVLIVGATGGLGSLAVQYLNAAGANVDGIASQNEWLEKLPLQRYFNYSNKNFKNELEEDYYDLVLDCADGKCYHWIATYMNHESSHLVSYSSPLIQMVENDLVTSLPTFFAHRKSIEDQLRSEGGVGLNLRYGFFNYSTCSFKKLHQNLRANQIKPFISETFSFSEAPEAFHSMSTKRHFGKVVIKMD